MTPTRNINIKYLHQYSISKEGRVFLGDREMKGIWADEVTYQFALYPSNHKAYPKAFKLEELYKATFYVNTPRRVKERLRPKEEQIRYREVFIQDPLGERASFQSVKYAARFLGVAEKRILYAIKHKAPIKGFSVIAI